MIITLNRVDKWVKKTKAHTRHGGIDDEKETGVLGNQPRNTTWDEIFSNTKQSDMTTNRKKSTANYQKIDSEVEGGRSFQRIPAQ